MVGFLWGCGDQYKFSNAWPNHDLHYLCLSVGKVQLSHKVPPNRAKEPAYKCCLLYDCFYLQL